MAGGGAGQQPRGRGRPSVKIRGELFYHLFSHFFGDNQERGRMKNEEEGASPPRRAEMPNQNATGRSRDSRPSTVPIPVYSKQSVICYTQEVRGSGSPFTGITLHRY